MRDSGTYHLMYMNALIGLENGHLMPWDKDILASAPLPDSVIDPFTTKEMPDVLESMKLTFNAMSIWVDEAKKVNYFSKRFVQLSRMVMNGITTMGRGLVTLHQRGEDLSQSPMSIQDLLGVASYHFRKSYLGVLQTSRSHPEIGERLLMNQIGWNNMLMRLFKTRDKLNSVVRIQDSGTREDPVARVEGPENEDGRRKNEEIVGEQEPQALPDTSDLLVQALSERTHTSDLSSLISNLTPPSAIREPGALTAPRAFNSFDAAPKRGLFPKATVPNNSLNPSGQAPDGTSPIAEKLPKATVPSSGMKKEENRGQDSERRDRNKEQGTRWYKEEHQVKENDQDPQDEKNQKENQTGTDNEKESNLLKEPAEDLPLAENIITDHPSKPSVGNSSANDNGDGPMTGQSTAGKASQAEKIARTISAEQLPAEDPSPSEEAVSTIPAEQFPGADHPAYLQILQNAFVRSGGSDDGKLTFTFDELRYLAADPDFNRIYPQQAAQMRSILKNIDSS